MDAFSSSLGAVLANSAKILAGAVASSLDTANAVVFRIRLLQKLPVSHFHGVLILRLFDTQDMKTHEMKELTRQSRGRPGS